MGKLIKRNTFFFREKSCMIKITLVFGVGHFWFVGSRMWCDKCRTPKSTILPKQAITMELNEKKTSASIYQVATENSINPTMRGQNRIEHEMSRYFCAISTTSKHRNGFVKAS